RHKVRGGDCLQEAFPARVPSLITRGTAADWDALDCRRPPGNRRRPAPTPLYLKIRIFFRGFGRILGDSLGHPYKETPKIVRPKKRLNCRASILDLHPAPGIPTSGFPEHEGVIRTNAFRHQQHAINCYQIRKRGRGSLSFLRKRTTRPGQSDGTSFAKSGDVA